MRSWTAEAPDDFTSHRGSGGLFCASRLSAECRFSTSSAGVVPLRVRRDVNESPAKPVPTSTVECSPHGQPSYRDPGGDEAEWQRRSFPSMEADTHEASQRLSRHIPLRDGVDITLSSYHLIQPSSSSSSQGNNGASHTEGTSVPFGQPIPSQTEPRRFQLVYGAPVSAVSSQPGSPPGSSFLNSMSFGDSVVSDDSSMMVSLYGERLAETFRDESQGRRRGVTGNGGILQFFPEGGATPHVLGTSEKQFFSSLPLHRKVPSPSSSQQHPISSHPVRVLEAPSFPTSASQLLDWGANSHLAIGLKQTIYTWNAETGEASQLADQEQDTVDRLLFIQKCAFLAAASASGAVRIYDCSSGKTLRMLHLDSRSTGMAVKGPMMALSSLGGTTRVFDLRVKDALTQTFHSRGEGVSCLTYSNTEPYYLATGGERGSVAVWDARSSCTPRSEYTSIHSGAVTALCWNPSRSRRLLSGGADGVLCHLHLHRSPNELVGAGGPLAPAAVQSIFKAHRTGYPISGVVWNSSTNQLVTSHQGKGHLQLRNADSFQLIGTFSAADNDAGLSCLTASPNKEHVCAAQADETLKMWRVFDSKTS